MTGIALVGGAVLGLMLAEARWSRANERALRAMGGVVPRGDIYGALVVLYPATLVAMVAEGLFRASIPAESTGSDPNWWLSGVLLFAASKALKYWAVRTLGVRWTFRIVIVPGLPLVSTGPYRYVAHPNYLAVCGELVGTAMMCGAPVTGVAGSMAYALALWWRARFETAVLRQAVAGTGNAGK